LILRKKGDLLEGRVVAKDVATHESPDQLGLDFEKTVFNRQRKLRIK